MSDARTYPHGVPCWVDTPQLDPEGASHFYAELFGWSFHDAVPVEVPGSYLIATLEGRDVAAIAPAPDQATSWNTYIAVDDADAAAVAVAAHARDRPANEISPPGVAPHTSLSPSGGPLKTTASRSFRHCRREHSR